MASRPRGDYAEYLERLAVDRGAKVLGIREPDAPPPVAAVPAPVPAAPAVPRPGELIVEFEIDARPIPWKASTILKRGGAFKDKKLVAWQDEVRRRGREAMGGREPYAGPVEVRFLFSLTRRAGSVADTSNLTKACEDSLQGVVIVNDRAVHQIVSHRTTGDRDFARVTVLAYTPTAQDAREGR